MPRAVDKTELPFKLFKRGKVRDIYEIDDNLLIVATDRISAFDFVLPDPIPNKGIYLTQLSIFWFEKMKKIAKNHLISGDVEDFPDELKDYRDILDKRSMLVTKTEVIPVECKSEVIFLVLDGRSIRRKARSVASSYRRD